MSSTHVDAVLQLIEQRRRDAVVDLVRSAARDDGFDEAISLLAAAQVENGLRWQTSQWSVAAEHAATAIVDLALSAVALDIAVALDTERAPPPLATIVVACAEEEWHVLPARMLAEQLRPGGWEVLFLGASTPADHLSRFLARIRPAAAAISCSVPAFLPGAARSVAACHAAGIPVVVGGAAFGATADRAAAVGADAWATTADGVASIVATWVKARPTLAAPPGPDRALLALAAERSDIVDAALPVLTSRFPELGGYPPERLDAIRDDLRYAMRFAESALLTGDDSIVVDYGRWLWSVSASQDLPSGLVATGMRVLSERTPARFTGARRLLVAAADAVDAGD